MSQGKKEGHGVRKNSSTAKSKAMNQKNKKKLSTTIQCLLDSGDDFCGCQLDSLSVPVRGWLAETFTTKTEERETKPQEKVPPRVITQAVTQSPSSIRQFRVTTSSTGIAYPAEVVAAFKDVDRWSFDVFALDRASKGHSLKYVVCEMFNKYSLLTRFQIPLTTLIAFAEALEEGYSRYQNAYHNAIHAADVTQTVHSILMQSGTMHWCTDLEILAIFFSSCVHDYDHPGTTNNFHILTRSDSALLYNDRSVLENHHLSAAYQLVQKPEVNILASLTELEWREMRKLVIRIVLGTDMSSHFQDMKKIVCRLRQNKSLDKSKVMSSIVHVADISHPAKDWDLHHRWVESITEEFFKQGTMEAELGLPISPLCDPETTNIAESEIGFIDIIIQPAFALMFEVIQKVIVPFLQKNSSPREDWHTRKSTVASIDPRTHRQSRRSTAGSEFQHADARRHSTSERGPCSEGTYLSILDINNFRNSVMDNIEENRNKWKEIMESTRKDFPEKESERAKVHIREDSDRAKEHVTEDRGRAKKHISEDRGKAKVHLSEDRGKAKEHLSEDRGKAKEHISEDRGKAKEHISEDRGRAKEHVSEDHGKAKEHVSEDHGRAKVHVNEDRGRAKEHVSEDRGRAKVHISEDREDKARSKRPMKRTSSNTRVPKYKKYCTIPQPSSICDCQLCDSRAFESMDVTAPNGGASEMCSSRQDSDAMEVTESYEELVDKESSWRKHDGQTIESNIQEMRALVPKTKPLSANESDDVIIEEFVPNDPQPQSELTGGPQAATGQECPLQASNVGFIMTDLTQSDMEIFALWNEEIMKRASEQQRQGYSRMVADTPLQVAISTKHSPACDGFKGASARKPPDTFILQVISFDSPSVNYSKDAVLNCNSGPPAVPGAPTNDGPVPAEALQQNQADALGAAAVSVTSLSYGVFEMPQ
ncbi:uncharacterized protein LOC143827544 isoform X2 [Paroedura picta]|uniref:uncharacterized protein LOC143827544 isoform X2 n=1 Tax=Paroedura picta TaxID=143630 RepID=UPI004056B89A